MSDKRYIFRIYKFNNKEKYNVIKKKKRKEKVWEHTLLPENTQKCQINTSKEHSIPFCIY